MFKSKVGESSGSFEQPAPGLVVGVLSRIVDWGTQDWGQYGPKRRVQFVWEVAQTVESGEYAGKHMTVSQMYTLSFNEKANLVKDLQSWRGRTYGAGEEIDLLAALGKSAMLNLVEVPKGQYTNININGVMPMARGMMPLAPDEEPWSFNLDEPDWDQFNRLSERAQETIAATLEFKSAKGIKAQPSNVIRNESGSRSYAPDPVSAGNLPEREPGIDDEPDFDDDISF